ncbi:MAG: methylenetetrahydromethanopterin dehydrogenase [Pirellulales bacterium]|nr:methylenetetrahydromethanopterin dehydrogenase [Pirellulales bacterium]
MKKILVCLDTDPQPSVFDGIVAIDAGVDHLFRHAGVEPADVRDLVHGALFTRGGSDLRNTAIFIGGSDVQAGELLMAATEEAFFGPIRVSVMHDSNGSNTTAAAAVVAARRHLPFGPETIAAVLGTGPVGQRVARMLAQEGVEVRFASRRMARAEAQCHHIAQAVEGARLTPYATEGAGVSRLLDGAQLVVAAGAAGIELVDEDSQRAACSLRVAIDLNAVPPVGLAGIQPQENAAVYNEQVRYGALGIGSLKMKIHNKAIARLFETNDAVLDADAIYSLGKKITATGCL